MPFHFGDFSLHFCSFISILSAWFEYCNFVSLFSSKSPCLDILYCMYATVAKPHAKGLKMNMCNHKLMALKLTPNWTIILTHPSISFGFPFSFSNLLQMQQKQPRLRELHCTISFVFSIGCSLKCVKQYFCPIIIYGLWINCWRTIGCVDKSRC